MYVKIIILKFIEQKLISSFLNGLVNCLFVCFLVKMKEKEEQQKQQERVPVVGIVTGVSYVSGIDYYKQLNELFISHQQQRQQQQQNQNQNQNQNQQQQQQQPSTPFNNPPILLNSIDCATYVYHLKKENYFSVCQLFVDAVKCLVGVVDVVGFASNTAHISFKAVKEGLFFIFYFLLLFYYFYFGVVDVVGFASNTAHISFKAVKEGLFFIFFFYYYFIILFWCC